MDECNCVSPCLTALLFLSAVVGTGATRSLLQDVSGLAAVEAAPTAAAAAANADLPPATLVAWAYTPSPLS
jgi:hypothetical protein